MDIQLLLLFLIPLAIIFFIIIEGFFSKSEMAMVSSNRIKLNYLAKNNNKKAAIILALLSSPERMFGTTLVGVNIATVTATELAHHYFENYLHGFVTQIDHIIPTQLLIVLVIEPSILIFGELFPMSLARKYPNETAMKNAYLIKFGYIIFFPLMLIVSNISKFIGRLLKEKESFNSLSRDELQILVSSRVDHSAKKTKKIIDEVFNLTKLIAEDVMVHLNDVKVINEAATVEEFRQLLTITPFSRFPVYKESIFNITGTIHTSSILGVNDQEIIANFMEKLYIIPSTKPVIEILKELQTNRKYMGIVVDEFGAACGIISIDDIVEEIVDEINEEISLNKLRSHTRDLIVFDARTYLDDFYEITGIDFRDEDAETLGGIINLAMGRIARKNEKVTYQKIEFEVIEATDRVVKLVKLLTPYKK